MTFKDKLRGDHPDWDEYQIDKVMDEDCPKHYGYVRDCIWCDCDECWDRKMAKVIPRTFEFLSDAYGQKQRIHVTVLEHFVQHYTGEHMYRIRMESEYGFVREGIYSKGVITYWLEKEKKD